MVLALLLGIAIPLIFLYLVRTLDLYASGNFGVVVTCLLWGMAAFGAAYQLNSFALRWVTLSLLVTLAAPISEEVLKSGILVYHVRRTYFTYFVDGAIYGFAAGVGFAVLETLFYVQMYGGDLGLSLLRSFSTSLMHGSSSALVGVALGRFRFARGRMRVVALVMGWGVAVLLHAAFNHVLNRPPGFGIHLLAVLIGLIGVLATVVFINWGLRQERIWLHTTLGPTVGVSTGEAAVVLQLADLDRLLAPVGERFGAQKQRQVAAFLRLQARLGLKRKAQELTPVPALRAQLAVEIREMRREMDVLRRAVGVYCMVYVRSILPPTAKPLWAQLEVALAEPRTAATNLWETLGAKVEEKS